MRDDTLDDRNCADRIVYDALEGRAGSMSAEHGVGLAKRDWLHASRSPEVAGVMRKLKACLDPKKLLNPGRVLPPPN